MTIHADFYSGRRSRHPRLSVTEPMSEIVHYALPLPAFRYQDSTFDGEPFCVLVPEGWHAATSGVSPWRGKPAIVEPCRGDRNSWPDDSCRPVGAETHDVPRFHGLTPITTSCRRVATEHIGLTGTSKRWVMARPDTSQPAWILLLLAAFVAICSPEVSGQDRNPTIDSASPVTSATTFDADEAEITDAATADDMTADDATADDATADNMETFAGEELSAWPYHSIIDFGDTPNSGDVTSRSLMDLLLPIEVLSVSKSDLSDLRLIAADGSALPYAVRVLTSRSVRDIVPTQEFNRVEPDAGVQELSLELTRNSSTDEYYEHNEVEIQTDGDSFRRAVIVEGGDDGSTWNLLVTDVLLSFRDDERHFRRSVFKYPVSRYRYLRVRVSPDVSPMVPTGRDEFSILSVTVTRRLNLEGEQFPYTVTLGAREPSRQHGVAASRWVIEIGEEKVPCDRLEFEVSDSEFVRDVTLEAESENRLGQPVFYEIYNLDNPDRTWRRSHQDPKRPMVLTFGELQARRFRLTVSDYRNKPLTLTAARASAAARQLIFTEPDPGMKPVRLYFGNPDAEVPNYDFARSLPDRLPTESIRVIAGPREENPDYIAPMPPLTERFPWLIYVTLGSVSAVLGGIILSLSKEAIRIHDTAASSSSDSKII